MLFSVLLGLRYKSNLITAYFAALFHEQLVITLTNIKKKIEWIPFAHPIFFVLVVSYFGHFDIITSVTSVTTLRYCIVQKVLCCGGIHSNGLLTNSQYFIDYNVATLE